MVDFLPALQEFHFQQTQGRLPRSLHSFTLPGVVALLRAPKLSFVNLEGAQGVTDLMINTWRLTHMLRDQIKLCPLPRLRLQLPREAE